MILRRIPAYGRPRLAYLTASTAVAAALQVLAPSGAQAQQVAGATADAEQAATETMRLEEILITAQKREQSLQDVGIAMTAFSGDDLDKYDVEKSFDIASMTPGVHVSGNLAGQNTQFTIRGVTQNDFNDIIESPNAAYLDEGYIAVAQAQTFATFDVERVEILKGPQGTLFGRNATGGLVHYISRKPVIGEWGGYIDATYGRYDSPADADGVELRGALNIPLADTLAGRVAFTWNKQDGYLENIYPFAAVGGSPGPGAGANLGDDDTLAGRAILLFEPSDEFRARLMANVERSNLATGPYQSKPTIAVLENVNGSAEVVNTIDVAPGETRASIGPNGQDFGTDLDNNGVFAAQGDPADFFGRFGSGGDFFGFVDPDGNDFLFSSDFAFKDSNSTDTWGVNLNLEWDLSDSITLTSVTDFKDYEKLLFIDVDAAPVNQSANYAAVDATSVTQEVRLSGSTDRSDWVVGFFFLNIDNTSDNGLKFPQGSVVPGAPFDLGVDATLKTNSFSAFGQYEYDISSEWRFIIGARIVQEEKDYHFEQNLYFTQDSRQIHQGTPILIGPIFDANGVPQPFVDETSNTLWAGNIQIDYRPSDDLLLFAAAKRGVKAGSFNAQLAGGLPIPNIDQAIPYDEEVLYSYEIGFKSDFADGRARLNGNVFYYDYNDYQAFLFTGVSGIVTNEDAEYVGADLQFQVSPIAGLDLQLAASYLDAEVKDVPLRIGGPIERDVRPTYAPEFQVTGMARYEWPLFGGLMSVMGDFSYSDEYFYNLRNFDADKFGSYFLLNARLGWISDDGRWEAAFKVENLTDERIGVQGFNLATFCGCNEISFRPPRWWGFSVRYSI